MSDISAVFVSIDVYSSTLEKLIKKTDQAVNKLLLVSSLVNGGASKILKASAMAGDAASKINTAAVATDKATQKLSKATTATGSMINKLVKAGDSAKDMTDDMLEAGKASENAADKLLKVGMTSESAADKLLEAGSTSENAADKLLEASDNVEKLNKKLDESEESSKSAGKGIKNLLSSLVNMDNLKKAADLIDNYALTNSKLSKINDGNGQTDKQLQDKIYAAAGRSRGSYTEMAGSVATLESSTGNLFSSNDETIAFTELSQKALVGDGLNTEDRTSTMSMLTDSMAGGSLSTDNLSSLEQSAPSIYNAISGYVGKSGESLETLAEQGKITADVLKNSMFAASADINTSFEEAPMTFADIWTRIKDAGLQAIAPVFENISNLISSSGFMDLVDNITVAIYILGNVVNWISGLISDSWPLIRSILIAIGLYMILAGVLALSAGLMAAAGWIAANAPLIMTIATIASFIYALSLAGITAREAFGIIGGNISVVIEFFKNLGLTVANIALGIGGAIGAVGTNIKAAFHNAISDAQSRWYKLLSTSLDVVAKIAAALNELPFVEFDYSGITSAADEYAKKAEEAAGDKEEYTSISDAFQKGYNTYDTFQDGWDKDAYLKGYNAGTDLYDNMEEQFNNIKGSLTGEGTSFSPDDYQTDPITVEGTGSNGALNVDMEDDDVDYLRDIAERDYIANVATNSLAPNISIQFGDVHENADASKIAGRIKKILQEEIAMASEGVY